MKISQFIEDIFGDLEFCSLQKIVLSDTEVFSDLATVADLDPKRDFRFSDLAGVDFRNSDLRGFDFTGADLRGTIGVNAQWDETTILSGAELADSMFAYEASKREFLSNSVWRKEFERRRKDFWPKNIEWFSDRFVKGHRDREAAIELAKAVCDETKDTFLRSQLLFFLAPAFDNAEGHRDYLIHNLTKHSDDKVTVRVTIQTMASLYGNNMLSFKILMQYIDDHEPLVRDAAMKGVLRSKFFSNNFTTISKIIPQFGSTVRHLYMMASGRAFNIRLDSLKDNLGTYYDINTTVSKDTVFRTAFLQLRREDLKDSQDLKVARGQIQIPDPKISRVEERSSLIMKDLETLVDYGVPIKLEWQVVDRRSRKHNPEQERKNKLQRT